MFKFSLDNFPKLVQDNIYYYMWKNRFKKIIPEIENEKNRRLLTLGALIHCPETDTSQDYNYTWPLLFHHMYPIFQPQSNWTKWEYTRKKKNERIITLIKQSNRRTKFPINPNLDSRYNSMCPEYYSMPV